MGSSLPSALTLPCREEEPQSKRKPKLAQLQFPGREEGVWLGAEAGANTAGITFSFLGEVERERVKGTFELLLHRLADICPVCPELRPHEEHAKVKWHVSAATVLKAAGPMNKKGSKMGHP